MKKVDVNVPHLGTNLPLSEVATLFTLNVKKFKFCPPLKKFTQFCDILYVILMELFSVRRFRAQYRPWGPEHEISARHDAE